MFDLRNTASYNHETFCLITYKRGNDRTVKDHRPKNLNLFTISFPIPAIVSILHRVSGVVLFLAIPFVIWGLSVSLASADDFDRVRQFFSYPLAKFIIWAILAPFIYHFVAGIRHLLMDVSLGDSLKGGRLGAQLTLVISIVLIILAGIWLW